MPIVSEAKMPAREAASGSRSTGLSSQGRRNLEAIARAEAEHISTASFSGISIRPPVLSGGLLWRSCPSGQWPPHQTRPPSGKRSAASGRCDGTAGPPAALCQETAPHTEMFHSARPVPFTPSACWCSAQSGSSRADSSSPSPVQVHLKATEQTQPALSTPVAASVSLWRRSPVQNGSQTGW